MKFEWDPNKEKINQQKHGVNFEQAAYVFSDPFALSLFDEAHSETEDRWIILGQSVKEMILVVVHTYRDKNGAESVRIISARKASKNEIKQYRKRQPK